MGKDNLFIEPTDDGRFSAKWGDAQRASLIRDTQGAAIDAARDMFPDVKPDVARVRHTKNGHPDQYRKA